MKVQSKKRLIPLREISFKTMDLSMKSQNYPSSGLYLVVVEDTNNSDIRFIDKSTPSCIFIAPTSPFLGAMIDEIETQTEFVSEELPPANSNSMSNNDFILEFSKILLTKK